MPILYPIAALGALAIAALVGCGDDEATAAGTPRDNGEGGASETGGSGNSGAGVGGTTRGSGGNSGTGGSSGLGASGGEAGSDGLGGSGGTTGGSGTGGIGGTVDAGGGGMDAGGMGGDAGLPVAQPYRFGMMYGPDSDDRLVRTKFHVNGAGALLFSDLDPCRLIGGQFTAKYETGFVDPEYTNQFGDPTFELSIKLAAGQSINACGENVVLPMAGGLFDGVSWLLTVAEQSTGPKDAWTITACEPAPAGSGEVCSGEIKLITQ